MIRLVFKPPDSDPEWDDWVARCEAEIEALLRAGGGTIVDSLYKEQRRRFLDASHGKCAYCELMIAPGQRHGDVEHYRPKGRVRRPDGSIVTVDRDGTLANHPGYYWLAYDWTNLLPSCAACNRRAQDSASESLTGKGEIFPLLNDRYAGSPAEMAAEEPALLNPWVDDPRDHLEFNAATGVVGNVTLKGRTTIDLLGLNRDGLPEERRATCVAVKDFFATLNIDLARGREHPDDLARLEAIRSGTVAFSAISVVALLEAKRQIGARLEQIMPD